MIVIEADKGYDSADLRQELLRRGFFPMIPWRTNIKNAPKLSEVSKQFELKPIRWVVERTHAWLKRRYRRLMVRWERKDELWRAMVQLALILEWTKNYSDLDDNGMQRLNSPLEVYCHQFHWTLIWDKIFQPFQKENLWQLTQMTS